MLSAETPARGRWHLHWRVAPVVLAVLLGLTGCVRPLYGPATASLQSGSVRSVLASVDVPEIPGRLGHTLRNELVFTLEGRDNTGPKRYRLLVSASESVSSTIVNSATQRADLGTLTASANFRLISTADAAVVATGSITGFASYERSGQRFANLRAARDAQDRVARYLAEQIQLQLATRLAAP